MTSVGLKCFLAKVLFPEPEAPIRTTSDKSGNVNFSRILLSPWTAGRLPFVLERPEWHPLRRQVETKLHIHVTQRPELTRSEIRRGSIQSGDPCGAARRQAWFQISRCTHGSA